MKKKNLPLKKSPLHSFCSAFVVVFRHSSSEKISSSLFLFRLFSLFSVCFSILVFSSCFSFFSQFFSLFGWKRLVSLFSCFYFMQMGFLCQVSSFNLPSFLNLFLFLVSFYFVERVFSSFFVHYSFCVFSLSATFGKRMDISLLCFLVSKKSLFFFSLFLERDFFFQKKSFLHVLITLFFESLLSFFLCCASQKKNLTYLINSPLLQSILMCH